MSNLMDIYNSTHSPLENPQTMQDIISAYAKSDRLILGGKRRML